MTKNNWVYVGSRTGAFVTTRSKTETRTTCTPKSETERERDSERRG